MLNVIDVGRMGPRCYVATECIEPSRSLAQRLESGRVSVRVALAIAHRVAAALQDASSEGLVSRHWGLSSVLLADDHTAKLSAWDFDDREANLRVGDLLGPTAFMPPEWLATEHPDVSPAVDIYRVGGTLYAMLTGRPPYVGESPLRVVHQILEGPPAPVRQVAPGVPEALAALCTKCLSREPAERYASLGDLMQAISSLAADLPPR